LHPRRGVPPLCSGCSGCREGCQGLLHEMDPPHGLSICDQKNLIKSLGRPSISTAKPAVSPVHDVKNGLGRENSAPQTTWSGPSPSTHRRHQQPHNTHLRFRCLGADQPESCIPWPSAVFSRQLEGPGFFTARFWWCCIPGPESRVRPAQDAGCRLQGASRAD
jgi:hypothetical protein